ncbi:MAG: acyl-[acyl-carrier-protein] thioesterase [Clostridiales bacterium]|nr:acyl-[acyl-carrier-protein] thioesterase [Clostridiales bacterium]
MYTFNSRVRYTEINHYKETMDPSAIINYFQDCSTFQSEDMNLGLSYLENKNRAWYLTSWQLQIKEPVRLGDYITIGTWPYAFKDFFGYRNFIMKDKNDKVLSVADSIWVHMDSEKGRPIKVANDNAGYKLEPPYPMEYMDRKIKIPKNLSSYPSFPVIKSNIDSYNHVNNGQYIKMAEEFLPEDFFVSTMRVEYKNQAFLGDIICPRVYASDKSYCIVLESQEGKPYAIVEFSN